MFSFTVGERVGDGVGTVGAFVGGVGAIVGAAVGAKVASTQAQRAAYSYPETSQSSTPPFFQVEAVDEHEPTWACVTVEVQSEQVSASSPPVAVDPDHHPTAGKPHTFAVERLFVSVDEPSMAVFQLAIVT